LILSVYGFCADSAECVKWVFPKLAQNVGAFLSVPRSGTLWRRFHVVGCGRMKGRGQNQQGQQHGGENSAGHGAFACFYILWFSRVRAALSKPDKMIFWKAVLSTYKVINRIFVNIRRRGGS